MAIRAIPTSEGADRRTTAGMPWRIAVISQKLSTVGCGRQNGRAHSPSPTPNRGAQHLARAVVVDVEPVLAGALGEDQVLDDVGEQPALHREQQDEERRDPERDADHPAAAQEGEAAVPDDHRGLQHQREQRRRGDRQHRREGDEAGGAEAHRARGSPEQEVDVGEDDRAEQAEVDRMREGAAARVKPSRCCAPPASRIDMTAEDRLSSFVPVRNSRSANGKSTTSSSSM